MKLLTGLFRATRRRLITTDNDMGMFRKGLEDLVAKKDELSDEEIAAKVEEVKHYVIDLPDSDDKAQVLRFLEDFKAVKEQDAAVAKEAAKAVADMFEKLDVDAMKDSPDVAEDEDGTDGEDEEAVAEEVVEVTEDGDNATYTLEELYQFIKQRMAEDAAAEAETETTDTEEVVEDEVEAEEEDVEVEDEEADEVVTDNAPRIPVRMGGASTGSLAGLFNLAKGGN